MSVTAEKVRDADIVKIEIDGRQLRARRGDMIIEAADNAGINIPRFCYHKKLSIAANCRMCLVEVEKVPKPLPACATPVTEGMKILTRSPKAIEAQKGTMEFLLINHPLDCPICDQGGECDLQEISIGFGADRSEYSENKRVVKDKDIGPLISTEMTRCIHCTRCVRFGEEIAGIRELGATGRGENTRIGTYVEQALTSELAGNIIDLCPVGALTSRPFRFTARAWEVARHEGIAAHDCVGSHIEMLTRRDEVMRVDPVDVEDINECWISDRDRFSYEGCNSDTRLTVPMIKQNGAWQESDWSTALNYAVEGLRKVIAAEGAEHFGMLVSPSATLEEQYLAQKLARGLGSDNVDHRLRQQDVSDQAAAPLTPTLGQPIAALEKQDVILLLGSNVQKDQPIIGHRIRKASLNGARVMAINPLDYAFNFTVRERLCGTPAAMVTDLAAVLKALCQRRGSAAPQGLDALLAGAEPGADHEMMAERLATDGAVSILLGNQAAMHPAAATLRALATELARAAGATLGVLSDGANGAGGWLAGAVPHRVAGGDAAPRTGLDAQAMLASPRKAYLDVHVEPELDCADPAQALAAHRDAAFVALLTPFVSEAMRDYADVLLPTTPWSETSGTFVNVEGRWQSFAGAVKPLGEARPAWKVLRVLGNFLDLPDFEYQSSEQVRDELQGICAARTVSPVAGGAALPVPPPAEAGLVRIADIAIYAVDGVVRRAVPLQQTADGQAAQALHINAAEAARQGVAEAAQVTVSDARGQATVPLVIDARVPDGAAYLSLGTPAAAALGACGAALTVSAG